MSAEVDIILPVYNRVQFLPAAIQSIVDQTFSSWHLFIVDDGSNEDISGVIDSYRAHPKITCIRQDNQGNAAARNTGILAGTSRYIAMLDSDDAWQPAYLSECLQRFDDSNLDADIVYTGYRYIDAQGIPLKKQPDIKPFSGDILSALLMGMAIPPSAVILKRDIIQRFGGFTPGMDDWELWLRLAWRGCKFSQMQHSLVDYRIHPENYHKNWLERRQIHLSMLDHFFCTPELDEKILQQKPTVYAWQYFLFGVQALQAHSSEAAEKDLQSAFRSYPALLRQSDTYWKIACAHQATHDMGTPVGFSIENARKALCDFGISLYDSLGLVDELPARSEFLSRSHHTLGMQAYSLAKDYRTAARYAGCAVIEWPAIIWRENGLRLLLKSIGKYLFGRLRSPNDQN